MYEDLHEAFGEGILASWSDEAEVKDCPYTDRRCQEAWAKGYDWGRKNDPGDARRRLPYLTKDIGVLEDTLRARNRMIEHLEEKIEKLEKDRDKKLEQAIERLKPPEPLGVSADEARAKAASQLSAALGAAAGFSNVGAPIGGVLAVASKAAKDLGAGLERVRVSEPEFLHGKPAELESTLSSESTPSTPSSSSSESEERIKSV